MNTHLTASDLGAPEARSCLGDLLPRWSTLQLKPPTTTPAAVSIHLAGLLHEHRVVLDELERSRHGSVLFTPRPGGRVVGRLSH